MIKNVPTAEDFTEHGLMFLNLAWDTVIDLLILNDDLDRKNLEQTDLADDYWKAVKRPLSAAHALAQQGAELMLKAEIADVSPFLLLNDPPSAWPKGCDQEDKAFADFRTIDAQDLVRACNALRSSPLPEDFTSTFNKFRKQRNALLHTVDERLRFSEKEIVHYILSIVHLDNPKQWARIRRTYVEDDPLFMTYETEGNSYRLCREMECMIDMLTRSELQKWFGFDKKQRRYICPHCYGDTNHVAPDFLPTTALLRPNTPQSSTVYCFVCDSNIPVARRNCQDTNCKGNVINDDLDYECLTCFTVHEEPE
jgi:hypothetical protein